MFYNKKHQHGYPIFNAHLPNDDNGCWQNTKDKGGLTTPPKAQARDEISINIQLQIIYCNKLF